MSPVLCLSTLVLSLALAATARAQSLVDVVPDDPCVRARALAPDDDTADAQHLRRMCRLERFENRLNAERQQELAATEQVRTTRIQRWIDDTQPARVTHPFAVEGYLGTGLTTYGLSASWDFLRDAELAASIGRRPISCDSLTTNPGDCSRTSLGLHGRWYLTGTRLSIFLSGGFSQTWAHLQIISSANGGASTSLVSGSGRANSVNGGGGLLLAVGAFRLSVEYVYEHVFYTGASLDDAKKSPSPALDAVWSASLSDDSNGVRFQVGYAF